jgi:hypothetical protein
MSMTLVRAGFTRGAPGASAPGLVIDQLFHVLGGTFPTASLGLGGGLLNGGRTLLV